MTYIDLAVLNLTEQICRRFQTWTGRTNVWLAFQLTNLSVIVYFVWVANLYWLSGDLAFRIFVAAFCCGVLWILSRTIFRMSIDVSETQAYARVAKGLRNPRRIRDAQLRIAFLTLSVVLSYPLWFAYITLHLRFILFMELLTVLTTVVLYVLACDPLPPCGAKVRGWLNALRGDTSRPIMVPHPGPGDVRLLATFIGLVIGLPRSRKAWVDIIYTSLESLAAGRPGGVRCVARPHGEVYRPAHRSTETVRSVSV